ncbi:hypothetical protein [Xanthobacter flavus]|uniref:hypothetical protein n=1 Tax=Xanthobacter flavus TaxID=281 RepID=UPI00372B985A
MDGPVFGAIVTALFIFAVRTLSQRLRQRKRPAPEPTYLGSAPMPFSHDEWVARMRLDWTSGGGSIVLSDDPETDDHGEIYQWVANLLNKSDFSADDRHILNSVYQSLNFDIPFPATKIVRDELLQTVRMKIKDPSWTRFPD